MSAILQRVPVDPPTGELLAVDGSTSPDSFVNGLPFEAGELAVDLSAAINHYHQGLPYTAEGRLAVTDTSPDYYGSGGAPFYDGRLSLVDGAPSHYSSGVPYEASGAVATIGVNPDGVRITDQPDDATVEELQTTQFSVTATSGDASPLTYQWQFWFGTIWANLPEDAIWQNVTSATMSVTPPNVSYSGVFLRCVVTNDTNSRNSSSAVMTVTAVAGNFNVLSENGVDTLVTEDAVDNIVSEDAP